MRDHLDARFGQRQMDGYRRHEPYGSDAERSSDAFDTLNRPAPALNPSAHAQEQRPVVPTRYAQAATDPDDENIDPALRMQYQAQNMRLNPQTAGLLQPSQRPAYMQDVGREASLQQYGGLLQSVQAERRYGFLPFGQLDQQEPSRYSLPQERALSPCLIQQNRLGNTNGTPHMPHTTNDGRRAAQTTNHAAQLKFLQGIKLPSLLPRSNPFSEDMDTALSTPPKRNKRVLKRNTQVGMDRNRSEAFEPDQNVVLAQRPVAPALALPNPSVASNISSRVLKYTSVADAKQHEFERTPLNVEEDDWQDVEAEVVSWVRKLMTAFEAATITAPDVMRAIEGQEAWWSRWQKDNLNRSSRLMTGGHGDDNLEKYCWLLFGEAIDIHKNGCRAEVTKFDKDLICSTRLNLCIDAISNYSIIRCDVLQGKNLYDLAAHPSEYAEKKLRYTRNNGRRSEENKKAKAAARGATKPKGEVCPDSTGSNVGVKIKGSAAEGANVPSKNDRGRSPKAESNKDGPRPKTKRQQSDDSDYDSIVEERPAGKRTHRVQKKASGSNNHQLSIANVS